MNLKDFIGLDLKPKMAQPKKARAPRRVFMQPIIQTPPGSGSAKNNFMQSFLNAPRAQQTVFNRIIPIK